MEFKEGKKRLVYNVDLDGILTNGENFTETEPTPNAENIKKTRDLYEKGNIIIIHTARLWEHAPETVAWLTKFGVPYHGIRMDKGGADFYIDDKSFNSFSP